MSPVKNPAGESGSVSDLVARYEMVIEQARAKNVSPDAVFEVLRMGASEWNEDRIGAAIQMLKSRAPQS